LEIGGRRSLHALITLPADAFIEAVQTLKAFLKWAQRHRQAAGANFGVAEGYGRVQA